VTLRSSRWGDTDMTDRLEPQRRFFAEEIEAVANLRSLALVEALASVPREAFLPPGPWLFRAEGDIGGPNRQTADADPRHLYHNVSVAIDPTRALFNGAPAVVGMCIDALSPKPGDRVLHVGCGRGYYSAVMAHCVGSAGRVTAIEVDPQLAGEARAALAPRANVEVRPGNGVDDLPDAGFDGILVNAGMSHPHEAWLRALKPGGRLVLPLTVAMPPTAPLGKGVIVLVTHGGDTGSWSARVLNFTMIYSAVAIRDAGMTEKLGAALRRSPWPAFSRLRRDAHDETASCWLHAAGFCLSS
jgi:protein-L-isoaspartate(D-aspartate) O-methyltransferase